MLPKELDKGQECDASNNETSELDDHAEFEFSQIRLCRQLRQIKLFQRCSDTFSLLFGEAVLFQDVDEPVRVGDCNYH